MKRIFIFFFFSLFTVSAFSQQTDTLVKKLDSLNRKADSAGGQQNNISQEAYNQHTHITGKVYFILLGSDFKQELTAPFRFKLKDWKKTAVILAATGALFFADEPVQRKALQWRNNNAAVRDIGKYVTRFGGQYEVYTLAAFGAYGFIFNNEKIKTTFLLATQSYVVGGFMESLFKFLSGRQRPGYYDPNSMEAEPKFHGPFSKPGKDINGLRLNSSFPSGHTTAAFAAATVYAMEYKDRPLVPIVAYSAATIIGLSRITENKHWLSDVFAGAALGFFTGRQVVNNYHRYAKISSGNKKTSVSFSLNYEFDRVMPEIVYRF
jgi:membrane-associated phospholipid phosphatase